MLTALEGQGNRLPSAWAQVLLRSGGQVQRSLPGSIKSRTHARGPIPLLTSLPIKMVAGGGPKRCDLWAHYTWENDLGLGFFPETAEHRLPVYLLPLRGRYDRWFLGLDLSSLPGWHPD